MTGPCTYRIRLLGQVSGDELNAAGPVQVTVVRAVRDSTLVISRADQSGLIGLLRYLNGMGYVILEVKNLTAKERKEHSLSAKNTKGRKEVF